MGYKSQAFKGVSWMGILRLSTRAIAFVRLAILARILSPSVFGVFGVATLVLSFLEVLTETGINVFLIQKKDEANQYTSSAWIVSIIRGCLISLVLVICASSIVNFFNSPESYNVILLIAVVPLVRGFINPSIINIQKEIQFQKEFYLRSALFLVDSLIVIAAAFITRSAESFAYGLIVSAILETILSFAFFKPWPKLSFEINKVKTIIDRGWWITATGIFSYIADNGDNIVVGKILGTSSLGLYQVAYKISTLSISEVTEIVNKVTFPVYSKFSEDKDRLFKAFVKVTSVSSTVAVLVGVTIFVFAYEIVLIVAGKDWLSIVPVVQILAFYGVLRSIFGNFSSLLLSIHRQDYVAKMTFIRVIVLLVTVVPLMNTLGLQGAAYAMIISILAEIPIMLFYLWKVAKTK